MALSELLDRFVGGDLLILPTAVLAQSVVEIVVVPPGVGGSCLAHLKTEEGSLFKTLHNKLV